MRKTENFTVFEAKLTVPPGVRLPDDYSGKYGDAPPDDYVMTYDRAGNPLSSYGDAIWDMSAYQKIRATAILSFHYWTEGELRVSRQVIIKDMKWIMFVMIFFSKKILAVKTLQTRLYILRHMARFCHFNAITLIDLLGDPIQFVKFIEPLIEKNASRGLSNLLSDLYSIGQKKTGIRLLTGVSQQELSKLASNCSKENKQHPVILTRIYSALIKNFMNEIERFDAVSEPFLSLVKTCTLDNLSGRGLYHKNNILRSHGIDPDTVEPKPDFKAMIETLGLQGYLNEVKDRHNFEMTDLRNITRWLTNIQWVCKQVVHIFSGMRDGEARRLPYDCLEVFYHHGKKHYRLMGQTTKLTDEITKITRWVTCQQAAKAIDVAQAIADVIYLKLGLNELKGTDIGRSTDYPLFVGTGYLGFTLKKTKADSAPYVDSKFDKRQLITTWVPLIEKEDIKELESIDPFRDWRAEEKFVVGKRWHLTNHQYRRSLAIYASSSGMVSLSSLRQQLQHITEEMTIYYAKGSAYAKDLVQDQKEHFYNDYQKAQPESQALAYIAQVLLSDEPIFGAHGTWLDQRIERGEPITKDNHKETINRFKRGEIGYKITPLGGCTTVEPCDKRAMGSIVSCLDCSKAVIKLTKIDRVIQVQDVYLSRLDPDSVGALAKRKDLEDLIQYREKIRVKSEAA